MRNLEGVRKNKPILNSEAGSYTSVISRISKASARKPGDIGANNGRLSRIEELEFESQGPYRCENCQNEVDDEEDITMALNISKNLRSEKNL